jgi:hypothetical protein
MVVLSVYSLTINPLQAGGADLGRFLTRPPTDCVAIDIPGRDCHRSRAAKRLQPLHTKGWDACTRLVPRLGHFLTHPALPRRDTAYPQTVEPAWSCCTTASTEWSLQAPRSSPRWWLLDLLLRERSHPPTPAHAKTCAHPSEHRLNDAPSELACVFCRNGMHVAPTAHVEGAPPLMSRCDQSRVRTPGAQERWACQSIPFWCARSASKGDQQPSRPSFLHRAGCVHGRAGRRQDPQR